MLSKSKFFRTFVQKLVSLGYFTSDDVDSLLGEFGGLQRAIRLRHYISAGEILAWSMAKKDSAQEMCIFIKENNELLAEHGDFMYYFVQGIVDQMMAMGSDVRPVIEASPVRPRVSKEKILGPVNFYRSRRAARWDVVQRRPLAAARHLTAFPKPLNSNHADPS
ncbi:hypothetical protein FHX14_000367 [Rhizobium sp. BK619]|uniref:hypothetical protein n=1 Tax=Rhizobium sp. BK619 TaxID=2586989 RepID=UPI001613B816|nr:hypothetical protein [Rhizobium sp. BK619]MBB3644208.1 hypothetical protein [Rhizobium sp. BK619]